MSRLIDIDISIKDILHQAAHEALTGRPENARGLKYAVDHMKAQPTAYDVDKVVEQLRKASYQTDEWIAIVKGAVKDE